MVTNQPAPQRAASQQAGDEPQRLLVPLGDASYPIWIGTDWLDSISDRIREVAPDVSHAMIVADASVASTFGDEIRHALSEAGIRADLFIVPVGETSKQSTQLLRLWDWMLARGADRRSLIIAAGGGVVGDLAGFAAATYQRGIRLVQVPTTVLSQVDSSVGGKTGINLAGGKNMVGAFWQPVMVAIDTNTLNSLPQREYRSGFAEVIKYGVIQRADLFAWLEANIEPLLKRKPESIIHAIKESCATKAEIVAADERETTGRRATLNYGHTFAHAIEATAGYGHFLHGEAVAIGMTMAARFAVKRGLVDEAFINRQTSLLQAFHLPITWPHADPEKMIRAMKSDKKTVNQKLHLILPTELGTVITIDNALEQEVADAITDQPTTS